MSDRPILFSAPMVRAILAGTKTQTRRAMNPQPTPWADGWQLPDYCASPESAFRDGAPIFKSKFGKPGDRLWVREAWAKWGRDDQCGEGPSKTHEPIYRADGWPWDERDKWRPSIHMPRWASRITLEVTGVRVERLQDISEADARAEGASCRRISSGDARMGLSDWWSFGTDRGEDIGGAFTAKQGYELLWESINGAGSWDANPWVWVIGFDVQSTGSAHG